MIDPVKHAEHLRMVHFTLVIMCVALLAASIPNKSKKVERALDQLQQIISVQSIRKKAKGPLNPNEAMLQKIGEAHSTGDPRNLDGGYPAKGPAALIKVALPEDHTDVEIMLPPLWHNVDIARVQLWKPDKTSRQESERTRFFFQNTRPGLGSDSRIPSLWADFNLESFRKFWDGLDLLNSVFALNRVYPYAYIGKDDSQANEGEWVKVNIVDARAYKGRAGTLKLLPDRGPLRSSWPTRMHRSSYAYQWHVRLTSEDGFKENYSITIPLSYKQVEVNAQAICSRLFKNEPTPGRFDKSFPALKELTEFTESLPLDRLKQQLESEQERSREGFEIFGVKLPTELIGTWGILSLLVVQLYFWLHLLRFVKQAREDRGNDASVSQIPWIGFYPEKITRFIFIFSSVGLPLIIVGYISFKAWQAYADITAELFIILVFNCCCVAMAMITLNTILRMWRSLENHGEP
jgi:hypothetical protein